MSGFAASQMGFVTYLVDQLTVPFEQIHLVFCCSVLVSIILCYLPVNYFDLVLICFNGYAFLRCHVARQLSSTTITMQVHQKHMIKTTSPNQTKTNCPPPTFKKFKTKDIPTHFCLKIVLFAPSFWCVFLVGRTGVRVGLGGSVTTGCRGLQRRGLDPKKGWVGSAWSDDALIVWLVGLLVNFPKRMG